MAMSAKVIELCDGIPPRPSVHSSETRTRTKPVLVSFRFRSRCSASALAPSAHAGLVLRGVGFRIFRYGRRNTIVLYNNIVLENNYRYTETVNKSKIAKILGNNMKRIRIGKQMSQGDICRKLGVDRSYISNVESGNKNPTLSTIAKLANVLDISVSELLK